MSKFILRAPDADKRHLEDYRHHWREHSYTETVDVVDGIARCNDETTKHMLTGLGYVLIDPSQVCECGYIALSGEEFSQHKDKCPRETREVRLERRASEIEAERAEVARKEERVRRASEVHIARITRKERKAIRRAARKGFELIESRLVCRDCGHVCMIEEEFAEHRRTCPERESRL